MRDFQREFSNVLSLECLSDKNQRAVKDGLGLEAVPCKIQQEVERDELQLTDRKMTERYSIDLEYHILSEI